MTPDPNTTVCWLRLTVEDLKGVVPGSPLAQKIMLTSVDFQSKWRESYVKALERVGVSNEDLVVCEDAPIVNPTSAPNDPFTVPETQDDGAYVMCWHYVYEAAVIPPTEDSPEEMMRSLSILREVSKLLGDSAGVAQR